MLNLTFVLQQLALPINIEGVRSFSSMVEQGHDIDFLFPFLQVDLNYPFYADDRLSIPKDQSRLFSTKDEFKTYQENLRAFFRFHSNPNFLLVYLEKPAEIRFPTECVYLAIHISHLGLVATAKKPQRRNNIIRELNR